MNVPGVLLTWSLFLANVFGQSSAPILTHSPDFVVNSAVPARAEELRGDAEGLKNTRCDGPYIYLERSTAVGDFIGDTAKIVRVTRYARTDETKALEILKKVWNGQFRTASCFIGWAETTYWSVESMVEFKDGLRSKLITDGYHVALQDRNGRYWFIRLGE